jgi:potassium efflux system protein
MISSLRRSGRLGFWLAFLSSLPVLGGATSTNPPSASSNANSIPLPEVAVQAEAAHSTLESTQVNLSEDPVTSAIEQDLLVLTNEIPMRLEENSRILSRNPDLETLRDLGREWQHLRQELTDWTHQLTKRASQISTDEARLTQLSEAWEATRTAATTSNAPPLIRQRVQATLEEVHRVQAMTKAQQELVLDLQSQVGEQSARVSLAENAIAEARREMFQRLLVRDGPAIWSSGLWGKPWLALVEESQRSLLRQTSALAAYARRKPGRFLLHGLVLMVLSSFLVWTRRRLRAVRGREDGLRQATLVFEAPIATAIVLSVLISGWIYPQAPRLLWAMAGIATLIPVVIVLRKLIEPPLFPLLNALVGFYILDQFRVVAASQEAFSRVLLLLETAAGTVFFLWLTRSARLRVSQETRMDRFRTTLQRVARLAWLCFLAAFLANLFGYESLSKLVGNTVLTGAYLSLAVYALMRIVDGLVLSALSVPPMGRWDWVVRSRRMLQTRVWRLLEWVALGLWVVLLLEVLSLRAPLYQNVKEFISAKAHFGSFSLSLGDLLVLGLSIWVAVFISRVAQFFLEAEVYPRVDLAPGLHYSISKMVHYVILLAGIFIAIGALGFDLTKLTILAGAVGVGVGFGLQNIINNFVSGLILLFERPVKIGDVVQLDTAEGVVERIGIRASVVRTVNGSEVIVPNGKFISDPVTNWTFSNQQRLLSIPLAIAAIPDPQGVMNLLKRVASEHPLVLKDPPPQVLLGSFGGGTFTFEVRVWTNRLGSGPQIRSDLSLAFNAALIAQNVTLR